MSGVFSMASHSVLQYLLLLLAAQLHGVCAHFLSFAAMTFLLVLFTVGSEARQSHRAMT
jgi:hypothetical protein